MSRTLLAGTNQGGINWREAAEAAEQKTVVKSHDKVKTRHEGCVHCLLATVEAKTELKGNVAQHYFGMLYFVLRIKMPVLPIA